MVKDIEEQISSVSDDKRVKKHSTDITMQISESRSEEEVDKDRESPMHMDELDHSDGEFMSPMDTSAPLDNVSLTKAAKSPSSVMNPISINTSGEGTMSLANASTSKTAGLFTSISPMVQSAAVIPVGSPIKNAGLDISDLSSISLGQNTVSLDNSSPSSASLGQSAVEVSLSNAGSSSTPLAQSTLTMLNNAAADDHSVAAGETDVIGGRMFTCQLPDGSEVTFVADSSVPVEEALAVIEQMM